MKIEFHYTYLIVALSFIITGYFSNLIIFTSIIIIHELGHYTIAKLNNLNPQKMTIYPFGGITKMDNLINTPIIKELSVALAGFLFQLIYFLFISFLARNHIIRNYIYNLFKTYHYSILLFNILPIYPLDGSHILTLLLSYILPYRTVMKLNIIISLITGLTVLIINYYHFNYTTILIILIIVDSIFKYHKNISYFFNRFLLERYLYKLKPKRLKKIAKITNMYKDKYHIIKEKNTYLTEKQVLLRRFKQKF